MARSAPTSTAPDVSEEPALFGTTTRLVGIVTKPEPLSTGRPAFLLINAGMTYRVGLNRIHVKLARELARMGFVVLRYDSSVLGDSRIASESLEPLSLEDWRTEPRQAMEWLAATFGINRFVLLGMCSGAVASLRVARDDPRVVGVALIGLPPPKGAEGARVVTRHYLRLLLRSSFRAKSWKAIAGLRVDARRFVATLAVAGGLGGRDRSSSATAGGYDLPGALRDLRTRRAALLMVHAEADEGLDHTSRVIDRLRRESPGDPLPGIEVIHGSNHVFTLLSSQAALVGVVTSWASQLANESVRAPV